MVFTGYLMLSSAGHCRPSPHPLLLNLPASLVGPSSITANSGSKRLTPDPSLQGEKANLPFPQACHSSPEMPTDCNLGAGTHCVLYRGAREVFMGKITHWLHCVTASPCRTAATMSCQMSPRAGAGVGVGFADLTLPESHQVPAKSRGDNSWVGVRRRPSSRGARGPSAENQTRCRAIQPNWQHQTERQNY